MMSAKLSIESSIDRILVVSLTNIGDVVLTCPVVDVLLHDFPKAGLDIVVGPKAVSLFEGHARVQVKVYDKHVPWARKKEWFWDLWQQHYDVVVDLRHTILPMTLRPRYTTAWGKAADTGHSKDKHLKRLQTLYTFDQSDRQQLAVMTTKDDECFFAGLVAPFVRAAPFVVIAPGAADSAKRWSSQGFAVVADRLADQYKIVFVGDKQDTAMVQDIQGRMRSPSLSLAGVIHLRQLAFILKKSAWALTHDSGVMHLACYFNVPVAVLWGPTNLAKYGPWSPRSVVIRRNDQCARCLDPKNSVGHSCMAAISADDVLKAVGVYNDLTKGF